MGLFLQQRPDQAHKFLLLGAVAASEESPDLDMLDGPARSHIGFVSNEQRSRVIPDEIPAIPIRALIVLAGLLHDEVLPAGSS